MYIRAHIFWRKAERDHRHKILRKTWFLLWCVPVFAHETILERV